MANSNVFGMVKICQIEKIRSEVRMKEFVLNNEYLVSEDGEIFKKKKSGLLKLKSKVDTSTYKRVWMRINNKDKRMLVHRVVAITYIPNTDNLPQVNHKDGNKLNNNVENLEWVTAGDNQRHAYVNNLKTLPKGELNGRSILGEYQVINIYKSLLSGVSSTQLAKDYNMSVDYINKIKRKYIWKHILADFEDMLTKTPRKRLDESLVHKICKCLVKKLTYKQTIENLGDLFTKDQFYDIKRGKCFKDVVQLYNF